VKFDRTLQPATFIERVSRFSARVDLGGQVEYVLVPNSGRLKELLFPGNRVFLLERAAPHRKTRYDIALALCQGVLVSVDARLPNALIAEAFERQNIRELSAYQLVRREVRFGTSRYDLLLARGKNKCLLEVKSVTLVKEGIGLFPDAPTERGARHVRELVGARRRGYQAAVVFCIQREDAQAFAPNDRTDPGFGEALREAARKGVRVLAYKCHVDFRKIDVTQSVPVEL